MYFICDPSSCALGVPGARLAPYTTSGPRRDRHAQPGPSPAGARAAHLESAAMEARPLRTVGLLLHPQRDCSSVVAAVREWAETRGLALVGREREAEQLPAGVAAVAEQALATSSDLVIAVGGDRTLLPRLRPC